MKQTSSSRKLNEEARAKIASILLMDVSDPRLALITVTGVEVSMDRSVCNVFISTDSSRYEEVEQGLESAKGRIRSILGRNLSWRVTPELHFIIDTTVDEAERISEALKNVPATLAIPKDEEGNPLPWPEEAEDAELEVEFDEEGLPVVYTKEGEVVDPEDDFDEYL